jgi:lipid-A-disaccharide synthase
MGGVARLAAGHPRIERLVIPTPGRLKARLSGSVAAWGVPVEVVSTESQQLAAFAAAIAGVAVTGTVTLELALAGVPMVTTYVAERSQARRWLKYRTKWASLPNAILDRGVVPEVLDVEPHPERLMHELRDLRSMMEKGQPGSPLVDPAGRVLAHVVTQRSTIAT